MRTEHINSILDGQPLASLTENDLGQIRRHSLACESCRRAFEAAQVTAALLQERVAEHFESPPFFQTRVLAELRERRAVNDTWAWSRLWRTAGGLAASMVATVATLAVLTFVVPANETANSPSLSVNSYSTEAVVLDENARPDDQLSNNDVLATLYETDDDVVK